MNFLSVFLITAVSLFPREGISDEDLTSPIPLFEELAEELRGVNAAGEDCYFNVDSKTWSNGRRQRHYKYALRLSDEPRDGYVNPDYEYVSVLNERSEVKISNSELFEISLWPDRSNSAKRIVWKFRLDKMGRIARIDGTRVFHFIPINGFSCTFE